MKHFRFSLPRSGILSVAFLMLAFGLLSMAACKKEERPPYTGPLPIDYTVLPPATQIGANTFGCLVNGEVWVPRVPLLAVTYVDKSATVSEKNGSGAGGITCNLVDTEKGQDNWLSLRFPPTHFGSISICDPSSELLVLFKKTDGQYYRTDLVETGSNCITITKIDTVANFVSGTFNFILYRDSTNLNDKIEITDGRFDLKYSPE